MVVIMIGRKRTMHASWMPRPRATLPALQLERKVTMMMPFFFTRPDQHDDPDERRRC